MTGTITATSEVETAPASLVDLLDRLLGVGVVLTGDVTISLADIDLITVRLRALIAAVDTVAEKIDTTGTGDAAGAVDPAAGAAAR